MINLPYIFAEMNADKKKNRKIGGVINTVCPMAFCYFRMAKYK
jgi:hypothetical protein